MNIQDVHASWKKVKCLYLYSTDIAFTQHKHDKYSLQTKGQIPADKRFSKGMWNSKLTCSKFVARVIVLRFLLVKKIGVTQDCTCALSWQWSYKYHFFPITMTKRYVNNLTIKHCNRTKVETITVKNSQKLSKNFKSYVSTFSQHHFQVKMNKKKVFEYKYTRNTSLESTICTPIFALRFCISLFTALADFWSLKGSGTMILEVPSLASSGALIKPVFQSKKISLVLSPKEKKPPIENNQCVVYKFQCDLCYTDYVRYTTRHFYQCIGEHKHSAIVRHLEAHGLSKSDLKDKQFSVLRKCRSKFDCLIFEMLFIE